VAKIEEPKQTPKQAKREMETLMALATNDTLTAAAEELNISRKSLYERIERYGLTEKLNNIRTAAQAELITGSTKAARNLIDKIDSQDENISLKASTETLDRVGVTKSNDNQQSTTNIFNQIQINDRKEFFGE
jgi:molybdenum-dependent DNA-binding transcriptional regulator ModE